MHLKKKSLYVNSVISTEQLVCRYCDIIVIAGNRVINQSDLGRQLRPSASVDPSSLGEYNEKEVHGKILQRRCSLRSSRNLRFPLGQEDCGTKSGTKSRLTEVSVSSAYKRPQLEKATLLFFFSFLVS